METYVLTGLLASLMGSASLYLASPHQRWLTAAWPPGRALPVGAMLLVAGLAAMLHALQPVAGVFVFLHWLMLLFVSFPYLGALLGTPKETMNTPFPKEVQPDWVSKTLAGTLLGFGLGVGCSGVFSALASSLPLAIKGQLAMWLVAPTWMACMSCVYFFRSGYRAWAWLAAANLLVFGILAALRFP